MLGIIGESGSGKTVLAARWSTGIRTAAAGSPDGKCSTGAATSSPISPTEMQPFRADARFGYIGSNPAALLDPTIPVGSQIVEKLHAVEPGMIAAEAHASG